MDLFLEINICDNNFFIVDKRTIFLMKILKYYANYLVVKITYKDFHGNFMYYGIAQ